MLIKSIKHDLMATYRDFMGIYIAILVAAIIGPFILQSGQEWMIAILVLVLFGVSIAILVVTFITIIRLYNQRLFSAEGYLTLTLPVKTHITIIAKILTGLIWSICTLLVFVFASAVFYGIYFVMNQYFNFTDITGALVVINMVLKTNSAWILIQSVLVQAPLALVDSIYTLTMLVFVITLVNTSFIKKGKLAIGVAVYMILGNLLSMAMAYTHGTSILYTGSIMSQTTGSFIDDLSYSINFGNYAIQFAGSALIIAALGFATWWLLEHKLEIE